MTDIEQEAAEIRQRLTFGNLSAGRPDPATVWERHPYRTPQKTIVVLGVMHGGTSALAAMLYGLGVDFGTTTGNNFEEKEIKAALRRENDTLLSVLNEHHLRADVWGFKFPAVFQFRTPQELHALLHNPYYFLVLRDVAAIAQFGTKSPDVPTMIHRLQAGQAKISKLLEHVQQLPPAPKMLVSYQRLLQRPRRLCEQIIEFLGIQPTRNQRLRALASVSPAGGYLMTPNDFGWKHERIG